MFPRRHLALLFDAPDDGTPGAGSEAQAPETVAPGTLANTPDTGTGEPPTSTPTVDWEDRYTNLQGAFTRTSQEAAEYRKVIEGLNSDDPELRAWAAEQVGISFEDDDAYEPAGTQVEQQQYAQLDPQVQQQLDALLSQQQQAQEAQQAEQDYQAYRAWADPQLEQLGVPEGLTEMVAEAAVNMPPVVSATGEQQIDFEGAWAKTLAFFEQGTAIPQVQAKMLDAYQKTKQTPHVASSGQAGVQVPDLTDRKTRAEYIESRFGAAQQQG